MSGIIKVGIKPLKSMGQTVGLVIREVALNIGIVDSLLVLLFLLLRLVLDCMESF
ncbi:hypothetical protein ACFVEL_24605 [Bacillus thuringiensis]|uniref:hypothetical protein n=1 Tax=Bacillus cereus group TaxID=86661 RepID=UPI0015C518BC|nr:hypothetical protein [Bacillus toyonensis]MED3201321.1 hypothetical protein [Bacillus toyonensis]